MVLGAPAGPAGPEPPEASRDAAEQTRGEDLEIFQAQSKDLEDFSSSEQGFGRFSKLRARIWKIFQAQSKNLGGL